MKRPIWARLDTESREVLLSPEEMKKRKRRSLIVDATVGAISLPFILLAILKLAGYYLFPVFFLLLIRSIFWSRTAGRELREYRRKHMKALREDQPFSVSAGWVTGKTLLTFSPFYAFWLAIGFFIAIGGFYAWLFLSIPSAFFAILLLKLTADIWEELELSRFAMWGLALGAYVLCLLPGAITAAILYI